MKDMPKQKSTVGILIINIFDKFIYIVPIQEKKKKDLANGIN